MITSYIIEHCTNKSPGEITDIRSSLVNNITFASLSVRIGLHRFLLAESIKLTEAIDRFYEHQEKNHHRVGQEVKLKKKLIPKFNSICILQICFWC